MAKQDALNQAIKLFIPAKQKKKFQFYASVSFALEIILHCTFTCLLNDTTIQQIFIVRFCAPFFQMAFFL